MGCSKLHTRKMNYCTKGVQGLFVGFKKSDAKSYRYGFNGQEKDDEIKGVGNSVNYKYRMEDTRLGRFLSIDPLSDEYPELTPYQVASLSPIWMNELEGLEGVPYTNPMQVIFQGFGQGIIGMGNWFDETFSWGNEITTTTTTTTTTKGPVTTESGVETKTTTETIPQLGGTLLSIRNAGKPVTAVELPPLTKTISNTTVSGYNQATVKKGNATFVTKATANENEAKVENSASANIKIKKVPVNVKGSVTQSTNGSTQLKAEVAKSNNAGTAKTKAAATYTNNGKQSNVKLSAGGETKVGVTKISTEIYIIIKKNNEGR
jgi:RHS repeat-associated protein